MVFMRIFIGFIVLILLFNFSTRKYLNPYKLIMIFGKKGSGKSTTLTKLARQHLYKGWTVYSTEKIPDTYYIAPDNIGSVQLVDYNYKPFNANDYKGVKKMLKVLRNKIKPYKPRILLLIDEVGMIWDNRNFKGFKTEVRDFFKLQRHYYVKCYLFSQTFDVDKKLRDLTDAMYLHVNIFRVFTYGKKITKYMTIKESQTDDSSNLAEGMKFAPFLLFPFGSRTLTFIPKWVKYFNSFDAPELEPMNYKRTKFYNKK